MAWPALAVVLLDQITKLAVVRSLTVFESVPVVTGFFNLVHVRNRGMAFGLLNRPDMDFAFYLLLAASIGAIILLFFLFFTLTQDHNRITLGLSLVLGGAVGNLIDRVRFREVVDFLDFYLGSYHWPAFNVADSAITVGTFWLAISLIFQRNKTPERRGPGP
ncbi:MAG: signal peptidase II [Thermodesulfobacteriota bacterium]|nr:signal peptidase II [Thermodesulfobacteriota bacterium]